MRKHLVAGIALVLTLVVCSGIGLAGQVVSTMRNPRAVMQARGFMIVPVTDLVAAAQPGDHAPAQMFEIIRPRGEAINIGRLHTSCTCVRLETPKTTFGKNERAIFILRNVLPTPPAGQNYAMYIQITSPIRTTLRYDTFVQSIAYGSSVDAPLVIGDPSEGSDGIEIILPSTVSQPPADATEISPAETTEVDDESETVDTPEDGDATETQAEVEPDSSTRPEGEDRLNESGIDGRADESGSVDDTENDTTDPADKPDRESISHELEKESADGDETGQAIAETNALVDGEDGEEDIPETPADLDEPPAVEPVPFGEMRVKEVNLDQITDEDSAATSGSASLDSDRSADSSSDEDDEDIPQGMWFDN